MPLEPAGIELQAQNFAQYIRQLDQIDRKQQEIFNVTSQKTGKTVDDVRKAYKRYNQALRENERLAAAQKTAQATQRQAFISTTQVVANYVKQIGQVAFELGKLGATYQAQQTGLNNLAASFGQSGRDIQKAIVAASRGTISDLDALQVANEALLLGVARTPAEFDKFTRAALTLGRTVGLTASESISRFTTALGRESLLRLDDFGAKASEVNAEIERLAKSELGKLPEDLSKAEKSAIFIEAALNVTGANVEKIGEDSATAAENFASLEVASENFKTTIGLALSDLNETLGITKTIASEINQVTEAIRISRGTAEGATLDQQIEATEIRIKNLEQTINDTRASLEQGGGLFGTGLFEGFFRGQDEAVLEKQTGALKTLQIQLERLNLQKKAEDAKNFGDSMGDTVPPIGLSEEALKQYNSVLRQAEQLQLSFSRAAEDTARKLARANEDVARKQGREVARLQERQAKDRDKLLQDQAKELDRFEKDRRKEIARAEDEIRKERQSAGEQQKRDQQRLHRELQQAQERFNLSQFQSERRFRLQEQRLIAEGDVIGLKELREDFSLQQQEEKENFALSQREQKDDARERQREQTRDLENRLDELKSNLEERRAELLASFDEQLREQQLAQEEARQEQQRAFAEAAEDRAIALAREEEDRRISQQRQLEDLGRSFAEQEGITAEGAAAIAEELEKVFGLDGVADNIITGFTKKTESEFTDLFDNLEKVVKGADLEPSTPIITPQLGLGVGTQPGRIGGVQEFQEGGIVRGPIGSPQRAIVHAGETVLPTHKQSFQMQAPFIPTQALDVRMSGGFNITGDAGANEEILQQATAEMTENFRIAVDRLRRRG